MLFDLVEAGIICEVKIDSFRNAAYQPAIGVGKLTITYVIESLERRGNSDIPVGQTKEMDRLSNCLRTFADDIENSPSNILLKDL